MFSFVFRLMVLDFIASFVIFDMQRRQLSLWEFFQELYNLFRFFFGFLIFCLDWTMYFVCFFLMRFIELQIKFLWKF